MALFTVSETAGELKVSTKTVYRLMASGQLAWVQVGAHRRVAASSIEQFVAAHTERVSA